MSAFIYEVIIFVLLTVRGCWAKSTTSDERIIISVMTPTSMDFLFSHSKINLALDAAQHDIFEKQILKRRIQFLVINTDCMRLHLRTELLKWFLANVLRVSSNNPKFVSDRPHLLLGPMCSAATIEILRFNTAAHRVPMITPGSPAMWFDDRQNPNSDYYTHSNDKKSHVMARTYVQHSGMANTFYWLFKHFNWKKFIYLWDARNNSEIKEDDGGNRHFQALLQEDYGCQMMREALRKQKDERGVSFLSHAFHAAHSWSKVGEIFEDYASPDNQKGNYSIFVMCATPELVLQSLRIAETMYMNNGEYLFISFNLHYSFRGMENDLGNDNILDNLLSIELPTTNSPRLTKIKNISNSSENARKFEEADIFATRTYGQAFYDSVMLYAHAVNQSGGDPDNFGSINSMITDPLVYSKVPGFEFQRDTGDRQQNGDLIDRDKNGTFRVISKDVNSSNSLASIYWGKHGDNQPPKDYPICGYGRASCIPSKKKDTHYKWKLSLYFVVLLASVIAVMIVAIVYADKRIKRRLSTWRVRWEDIERITPARIIDNFHRNNACLWKIENQLLEKEVERKVRSSNDLNFEYYSHEVGLSVDVLSYKSREPSLAHNLSDSVGSSRSARSIRSGRSLRSGTLPLRHLSDFVNSPGGLVDHLGQVDINTTYTDTPYENMLDQTVSYMHVPGASFATSMSGESFTCDFFMRKRYTTTATYKGKWVALKSVNLRKQFDPLDKEFVKKANKITDIRHEHIATFVGACILPPNGLILSEYCSKGSISDLLSSSGVEVDWFFKFSLLQDIVKGMMYLHANYGPHGNLKSSNCLVDSHLAVKISDFGLHIFRGTKKRNRSSFFNSLLFNEGDDPLLWIESKRWTAPELLRIENPPDQGTYEGDVYSFAIIAQEIIYQKGVFYIKSDKTYTAKQILKRVARCSERPFRPTLSSDLPGISNDLVFIIQRSWDENPELRPNFQKIKSALRKMTKDHGNIFDNLIHRMDQYNRQLETLVSQRTKQYEDEKLRAENLLYCMLPRSVAEALMRNEKVEAESYDSVTVYFSDIVKFTTLSVHSTPMQIVDMLNKLYTLFDDILGNFDVYKVETIGDAYMVTSGCPVRNSDRHAAEICRMTLAFRKGIQAFVIPHMPERRLLMRVGIHSGPVCAGVIGIKMPRYCLFGDTVNTASRMEHYGEAGKIQISSATKALLDVHNCFVTEKRGPIKMKGKGLQTTYWLLDDTTLLSENITISVDTSEIPPIGTCNLSPTNKNSVTV